MVSVIDYDAGNILSVMNALSFLGFKASLESDPLRIERADFVVLPGVGAFGAAMRSLEKSGMDVALRRRFEADRPTLGICLGLQLLFESSEESEGVRGLGLIKGRVRKLPVKERKVPHIGWTTLENCRGEFAAFENEYFYFVHSFAACAVDDSDVIARADYDGKFTAAVRHGNTVACQFHPEKSGEVGLKLLSTLLKGVGA